MPQTGSGDPAPLARTNWKVFFGVLLAPVVVTSITAVILRGPHDNVSPFIGLAGGGAAGIACGIMLAFRIGKTSETRVVLSILLAAVMAAVSVTMCCIGCNLSGYELSF
jgi:hypothetical protein